MKNLCIGTQCVGFYFLQILDLWDIIFHAVIVFGLGKNLLIKSVLGSCENKEIFLWCIFEVNELYILKRKKTGFPKRFFNTFLLFLFLQDVRKMDSENRENTEPPVKFTSSTSSTSLVSYFNYSSFEGSFTNYVLQEEGGRTYPVGTQKMLNFLSTFVLGRKCQRWTKKILSA